MQEIFELFDENLQPTGETVVRGEPIPDGRYHIVVFVMTVNRDGKILMTKRAPEKTNGGWWEITGGSKIANEAPEAAACRELYEETGIAVTENELLFCGRDQRKPCFYFYYCVRGVEPDVEIRLQAGETVDARWVTPDECDALLRQNDPNETLSTYVRKYYGEILAELQNGKDGGE